MKILSTLLVIASVTAASAYGVIKVSQSHQQAYNSWITLVEKYEGQGIDTIRPNPNDINSFRYVYKSVEWKTFLAFADSFNIPATPSRFASLTDEEVFRIREQFWYQSGANQIQDLAVAAFFAEMYYASPISIRYFQNALRQDGLSNLKVTGKLDEPTSNALNNLPKRQLWNWLLQKRKSYIYNQTASESMRKYRKGLLKRAEEFHQQFEPFLSDDIPTNEIPITDSTSTQSEVEELETMSSSSTNSDSIRIVVSSEPLYADEAKNTSIKSVITQDSIATVSDTQENGVRIVVSSEQ